MIPLPALSRLLGFAVLCAAVACADIGTDPKVGVAIEVDPPQLPSLIAGDVLRDSLGNPVTIVVRVFNGKNEVIATRADSLVVRDPTIVSVDQGTGAVLGLKVGQTSLIAGAGRVQSLPVVITVTPRPDSALGIDTLGVRLTPATRRITLNVDAALRFGTGKARLLLLADTTPAIPGDALVPVQGYRVKFRIVYPAPEVAGLPTNGNRAILLDDQGRASEIDTTDASGIASRAVGVAGDSAIKKLTAAGDSLVVQAHVFRPTRRLTAPQLEEVPGSPVTYTFLIVKK